MTNQTQQQNLLRRNFQTEVNYLATEIKAIYTGSVTVARFKVPLLQRKAIYTRV